MKLIFATNNRHKVEEVLALSDGRLEILTLAEAGINIDIPEPHPTLDENASEKSKTIYRLTGSNCFSEDTGLEVDALGGEPGVKSARYAGESRSFDQNIEKLLLNLKDKKDRSAQFRAVISLILDGREQLFEGVCRGKIIFEKKGDLGFGYDPVFVPEGDTKTFAEMDLAEKSRYSHRARAFAKMAAFLSDKQ